MHTTNSIVGILLHFIVILAADFFSIANASFHKDDDHFILKQIKYSQEHLQNLIQFKRKRYQRVIHSKEFTGDNNKIDSFHSETDASFVQQKNSVQQKNIIKMSMENVTCYNYTQPLDHFNPGSNNFSLHQRYCIYNGYESNGSGSIFNSNRKHPIFFYTGNESPIDEYVNNTGLMWELGERLSALIVFAEHRFEGTSVPLDYYDHIMEKHKLDNTANEGNFIKGKRGCFTYLTTSQTLADYASLISFLNPNHDRPVITFGGSYGGMLSAWMRLKYGSIVAGSIASSAPIWGLPKTLLGRKDVGDDRMVMDRASHVVGQALLANITNQDKTARFSEQDKETKEESNYCFDNLLATWPLITYYGQSVNGRQFLTDQFQLCAPLSNENDVITLLEWVQSPWFDLAEGDYPYPSSYVPYALGQGLHDLPAWPLQEACHGSSGLNNNFGIKIVGNKTDVKFDIQYGGGLTLHVDWDVFRYSKNDTIIRNNSQIIVGSTLLSSVREAVSIWFNVTQDLDCFDVIPAINQQQFETKESHPELSTFDNLLHGTTKVTAKRRQQELQKQSHSIFSYDNNVNVCHEKIHNETVWSPLVCNDNINLIMTYARGMGRDFFWPPSHPRDQQRYQDLVANRTLAEQMYETICADPQGLFGYPDKSKFDPYSTFLDDSFGGLRLGYASNIIFSNGLLDPWSAAGVIKLNEANKRKSGINGKASTICNIKDHSNSTLAYDCSMVQNITKDGSIIALVLDLGGHHLDLFYSSFKEDPLCAKATRLIEEEHILHWIQLWKDGQQYHGSSCGASDCNGF